MHSLVLQNVTEHYFYVTLIEYLEKFVKLTYCAGIKKQRIQ